MTATNCYTAAQLHPVQQEGSRRTPLVVGVFQDQPLEHVRATVAAAGLDLVQLHGSEGWPACTQCDAPVIRVVHIPADDSSSSSADRAEHVLSSLVAGGAAAVLLDTSVGSARGGTGVVFDLAVAQAVAAAGVPVIVAGGLKADNVASAVAASQGWGVDVSSGVELSPGQKDKQAVQQFLKAARRAHAALASSQAAKEQ
jgi:phosphoribosylanthranilate isomerase